MHKEFTDERPSSRQEIVDTAQLYSLSVHYHKILLILQVGPSLALSIFGCRAWRSPDNKQLESGERVGWDARPCSQLQHKYTWCSIRNTGTSCPVSSSSWIRFLILLNLDSAPPQKPSAESGNAKRQTEDIRNDSKVLGLHFTCPFRSVD